MNKNHVKQVAISMVEQQGLINLSCNGVCAQAGISPGSFRHIVGCSFLEFISELIEDGYDGSPKVVVKKRTNPELRKAHILEAAMTVAKKCGYDRITRDGVAEAAGVSPGLVSRYFETMPTLRGAVLKKAIEGGEFIIVAQGIVRGDPIVETAPAGTLTKALSTLANSY